MRQEKAAEQSNARRCRGANIVREVINGLAITWHVTANAAWPLPQEQGSSTLTRTPRPMCSRVTTTDGRSPGSRVAALRRLPKLASSVAFGEGSPLTVAGAATALGKSRTVFPIDLPKENRRSHPSFVCEGLSTGCSRHGSARRTFIGDARIVHRAVSGEHESAVNSRLEHYSILPKIRIQRIRPKGRSYVVTSAGLVAVDAAALTAVCRVQGESALGSRGRTAPISGEAS
jgi:hypothetical protein